MRFKLGARADCSPTRNPGTPVTVRELVSPAHSPSPSLAPPGERGGPYLASGLDQRVHGATVATAAARQDGSHPVVAGSNYGARPPAGRCAPATSQTRNGLHLEPPNWPPALGTRTLSSCRAKRRFQPSPVRPLPDTKNKMRPPLSALARVERGWGIGGVLRQRRAPHRFESHPGTSPLPANTVCSPAYPHSAVRHVRRRVGPIQSDLHIWRES